MRLINKITQNKVMKGKVNLKLYLGEEDEGYCDFHNGDIIRMIIDVTKSDKLMRGSVSADFMYLTRVVIASPTLQNLVETFNDDEISFEITAVEEDNSSEYPPDSVGALLERQKQQDAIVSEVVERFGPYFALPKLPANFQGEMSVCPEDTSYDVPSYEYNESTGEWQRKYN